MIRHFTATAFVQNLDGRVLLLWHKKLNRWMSPGGHIDPNETPEETAKRECKEETGLDVEIMGDEQSDLFGDAPQEGRMLKKPFAMLLENIPANPARNQDAHQHMDFLFLARPINPDQTLLMAEAEADQLRWFTIEEIDALTHEEIFENVRKAVRSFLL